MYKIWQGLVKETDSYSSIAPIMRIICRYCELYRSVVILIDCSLAYCKEDDPDCDVDGIIEILHKEALLPIEDKKFVTLSDTVFVPTTKSTKKFGDIRNTKNSVVIYNFDIIKV